MSGRSLSGPHIAWSAGHAIVVLASSYEIIKMVTFSSAPKAHSLALFGALISWGIVVFKAQGVPQPSKAYLQRLLLDENAQYLLLVIYWLMSKPIGITILPFATFSIFHILTFVRTTFLPKPPTSKSGAKKEEGPQTLGMQASKQIQTLVKRHYEHAMLFVSYVEIAIMLRVVFGIFFRMNGLTAPIIFGMFLRLRYYLSPATRKAFATLNAQIDKGLNSPSCPPAVRQGVNTARALIIRYAEAAVLVQPPQQQQPAAGNGARPNNGAGAARR